MHLKDILRVKGSKVWTIKADHTIQEALRILVTQNIGALLVMGARGQICGILSERDIVRGSFRFAKDLNEMPVAKLMTKNVILASPDDSISNIMAVMTEHRVRHIPVVEEGELKGLISIGDVVKWLLQDSEHQIRFLREYMYGPSL